MKIKNKLINLDEKFLFISGEYKLQDITEIPLPIYDWNLQLPTIFQDLEKMKNFIMEFPRLLDPKNISQDFDIFDIWMQSNEFLDKLSKYSTVFQNLMKIQAFIDEKGILLSQIKQLHQYSLDLKEINENSVYQTKLNLLRKLEEDYDAENQIFEIQKDEYLIQKQKMDKMVSKSSKIEAKLDDLKIVQRELFKQTNEITTEYDNLENSILNYKEKIDSLSPITDEARISRISKKLEKNEKELSELHITKNTLLAESKSIKKNIQSLKVELRNNKKDIQKIIPEFSQVETNFKLQQKKQESLTEQIQDHRKSLDLFVSEKNIENTPKNSSSFAKYNIPYTSLGEIENKLTEKEQRLIYINSKLQEVMKSDDIALVQEQIDEKQTKLSQALKILNDKKESLKLSNFNRYFENIVAYLSEIEKIFNILNADLEVKIHFTLFIEPENPKILEFNYIFLKKDIQIDLEKDLKQIEYAQVVYSFIFCLYKSQNLKLIPLNLDNLPVTITSKQIFSKSISKLMEIITHLSEFKDYNIVFFIGNRPYELKPIQQI